MPLRKSRLTAGFALIALAACTTGDIGDGEPEEVPGDAVAAVTRAEEVGGSIDVTIEAPRELGASIAPKGSIALDGVSLTVNQVEDAGDTTRFTVNLIPHTADHTTLGAIAAGRKLNLEIDVLARYLKRMTEARG